MKKLNTNKGITLVALIITIIILLILSVVSIKLIVNEGILDKAQSAVEEYKISSVKEEIELAVQDLSIDMQFTSTSQEEKIEFLKNKLEGAEVKDNKNNGFIIEYKGYKFEILNDVNNNYSVEIYVRLPSAYQEVDYIESTGTQYIDTGISADYMHSIIEIELNGNSDSYFMGFSDSKNQISTGGYYGGHFQSAYPTFYFPLWRIYNEN